jgi:hypothetical protein
MMRRFRTSIFRIDQSILPPVLSRVILFVMFVACLAPSLAFSDQMAKHPTWLALLHHDRNDFLGNTRSAVVSHHFFLSPGGAQDPEGELRQTIALFDADPNSFSDNEHPVCRFPARAMWLNSKGLVNISKEIQCSSLSEWLDIHAESRIGLVFADGYLGNPASFFGHLLLHIAPDGFSGTGHTRLLETSVNFGADVPTSDGLFRYMTLGIFGGYTARFMEALFYENSHVYSERQMRDLWLYYLDISEIERDFFIKHLWELRGVEFNYLFLTQNCASRIARLVELVTSRKLLPTNTLWVSPEQVVRALNQSSAHDKPLLSKEVIYFPSRRAKAEHKYRSLDRNQRDAAHAAWPSHQELNLESPELLALDEYRRATVIDTLLNHVLYLQYSEPELNLTPLQRYLLMARLELPPSVDTEPVESTAVPVHEMRPPSYVGVAARNRSNSDFGMALSARVAQYDLLSGSSSRMPYSALEILVLDLEWSNQSDFKLQDATLFSVTNLMPLQNSLPSANRLSWHASLGWRENQFLSDDRVWQLDLLAGKSVRYNQHLVYGLFGFGLHARSSLDEVPGLDANFGVLTNWDNGLRTNVVFGERLTLEDAWGLGPQLSIYGRYMLSSRTDLSVEMKLHRQKYRSSIGVLWYF